MLAEKGTKETKVREKRRLASGTPPWARWNLRWTFGTLSRQGKEVLEEALGETMYKEVVMGKEKIAKENERLQAEIQRLRTMASSASTTPSWVEVDKPPSTPKRSTSAVPNYTPGGTRLPMGPPPEDDEVFVFVTPPPLPPTPPFPEVENVHAGDGWGVMWKPVPQKEDMGPTWPRGYPWDVPQQRWAEDKPKDPKAVQHRLQAAQSNKSPVSGGPVRSKFGRCWKIKTPTRRPTSWHPLLRWNP